jgi:hypothetical protein
LNCGGSWIVEEEIMDFSRIKRDGYPILLPEWNRIIQSSSVLVQVPDRTGTNPFTKETVIFPGEGKAHYVVAGKTVGNASLEDGEILTTGIPRDVCEQIARVLKAVVFEDDRS